MKSCSIRSSGSLSETLLSDLRAALQAYCQQGVQPHQVRDHIHGFEREMPEKRKNALYTKLHASYTYLSDATLSHSRLENTARWECVDKVTKQTERTQRTVYCVTLNLLFLNFYRMKAFCSLVFLMLLW